jgi:type I restriction enzyme M protein
VSTESRRLVAKLWNYCDVLRDDGVSTIDYVEQLTFLLFLKMAHERANRPLAPETALKHVGDHWQTLLDVKGNDLEIAYREVLQQLSGRAGHPRRHLPQGAEQDSGPGEVAAARRRPHRPGEVVGREHRRQGDAYEELLAKSAEDVKSGAGQYFHPTSADLGDGRLCATRPR